MPTGGVMGGEDCDWFAFFVEVSECLDGYFLTRVCVGTISDDGSVGPCSDAVAWAEKEAAA
jgi:hypothetical protein